MDAPKYNIGQKVKGINNVDAIIVAIIDGEYHYRSKFKAQNKKPSYDLESPDWKNKAVYIIEFDEPTQCCTLQEFVDYYKNSYEEEYLEKQWEKLDKACSMTVPEYNIKLLDKENE